MQGFDSIDWDSVPDVSLDGRSIPRFPDPHPEFTAAVWERWRADQAARKAVFVPEADAGDDVYRNYEPPVITMAAEEFDEPISALGTYVKLALGSGWTLVELAHARSAARGKVIQSGQRAGERHPDRQTETQWIKLEKPGVGRAVISYTIHNGKTDSTATYRSFNGTVRSDADMKAILRGEQ